MQIPDRCRGLGPRGGGNGQRERCVKLSHNCLRLLLIICIHCYKIHVRGIITVFLYFWETLSPVMSQELCCMRPITGPSKAEDSNLLQSLSTANTAYCASSAQFCTWFATNARGLNKQVRAAGIPTCCKFKDWHDPLLLTCKKTLGKRHFFSEKGLSSLWKSKQLNKPLIIRIMTMTFNLLQGNFNLVFDFALLATLKLHQTVKRGGGK